MKTRLIVMSLFWASAAGFADLDWGGGATRFLDDNGTAMTSENGLAVLVATTGSGTIDFKTISIQERFNLLTLGATIQQGNQSHRVVSISNAFVQGYLLNTLVDDLTNQQQASLGVTAGQRLSLIVWDRSTFSAGIPVAGSRFETAPLFLNGTESSPALAYGGSVPDPGAVVFPSRNSETTQVDATAGFPSPFTLQVQPGQAIRFVFPATNPENHELDYSATGSP